MGTSAEIKIKGFSVSIYKHYDGYESATLPWLKAFTAEFLNKRGADKEYFFAQLLRSSARDAKKYQLDDSEFTGWGIVESDGVGVDCTYIIDLENKTIQGPETFVELCPQPNKKVKELHIEGRRWFQKTYGNTYNTSRTLVVFEDGSTKEYFTPMEYGYGEHFKDLAIQNLVKEGVLPEKQDHYYWADFEKLKIKVYTTAIDCLKRDLHKEA